jgi:murein L,D-transpeptidase YafK
MQTAALGVGARPQSDASPPGRRLYEQGFDGARLDPFNWTVHIFKSQHRVEVYYEHQLFSTYHAVFGRGGLSGGKEWAGDSRTPEGSYLIVSKHPSARFDWFLELNYPNGIDAERFEALRASHEIPSSSHEGSKIGIHGTDSPLLNVQDVNWTLGCISVDNSDIDEMASLLPVGTLVVINP